MKAILSTIDAAIAKATAPSCHAEVTVLGYSCPCCCDSLAIRSIPRHADKPATWNTQRRYLPICLNEDCPRSESGWINEAEEHGTWNTEESAYKAIVAGLPR
jgi:hypothetical protein